MTFKDKTLFYLYRKNSQLENEFKEQLQYFRFHSSDEVDFLELIIRKVRSELCNEILHDTMSLLNLKETNNTKPNR